MPAANPPDATPPAAARHATPRAAAAPPPTRRHANWQPPAATKGDATLQVWRQLAQCKRGGGHDAPARPPAAASASSPEAAAGETVASRAPLAAMEPSSVPSSAPSSVPASPCTIQERRERRRRRATELQRVRAWLDDTNGRLGAAAAAREAPRQAGPRAAWGASPAVGAAAARGRGLCGSQSAAQFEQRAMR